METLRRERHSSERESEDCAKCVDNRENVTGHSSCAVSILTDQSLPVCWVYLCRSVPNRCVRSGRAALVDLQAVQGVF